MNFSKRVIILDKLNSTEISQAIFILKDSSVSEYCAVSEAERLVNEYLERDGALYRKRSKLPYMLCAAFLLLTISALLLLNF